MTTTITKPAVETEGKMTLVPFTDNIYHSMEDPEWTMFYLRDAIEDTVEEFLDAVKLVVKAKGGMTRAAEKTGFAREVIYQMLGEKGNPSFRALKTIIEAYGFEFTIRQKG